MRRRKFGKLVGGATATFLPIGRTSAQQQRRLAEIGYLSFSSAADDTPAQKAFFSGLSALGYVEGKNIHIEYRYADRDNGRRLATMAAELAARNVDVIVTFANGVPVARQATSTIPIVQATGVDPVALGLTTSLARPDGNVTGMAFFSAELVAKRLEFLRETIPSLTRAGALFFKGGIYKSPDLDLLRKVAEVQSVDLRVGEVHTSAELEARLEALVAQGIQGLVVSDHALFRLNASHLTAFAGKHKLPLLGFVELCRSGGLLGYGVDFSEQFRRSAFFVDRILKGARPSDLPIEQATKFELVINMKTAKTLGLTFPLSILARANEVIE